MNFNFIEDVVQVLIHSVCLIYARIDKNKSRQFLCFLTNAGFFKRSQTSILHELKFSHIGSL